MKNIILFSILIFITIRGTGQEIEGFVYNAKDSSVIENVLVRLTDNDRVFALTDKNGHFKLENIQEKNVHLSFSHIAFEPLMIANGGTIKKFYLNPISHILNDVVIKSNWIYRRDGNVIVDLTQMPLEQNKQLSETMKHIPGIIKDSRGSYQLNGMSADIYINGIKQTLTVNSLESFLQSIPTNIVSNIELISLNSGKYSASTEAVININTKTNISLGKSFQPYVFTSFFPYGWYDMGGNIFYMEKKGHWIYNGTLSYSNERYYDIQHDSLKYSDKILLDDYSKENGRTNVITFRGSATLEFQNDSHFHINTFLYYDKGNKENAWKNLYNERKFDKQEHSDLYNISLGYTLPKQNKHFYGNMSYSFSYGNDNSNLCFIMQDGTLYRDISLHLRGYMNTINTDFNTRKGAFLFSYGTKLEYNSVTDKTMNSLISDKVDNYEYFKGYEILSALYTQTKYELSDKVSFRIGLRIENTDYTYNTLSYKKSHNYTSFFPSFLTYYDSKDFYSTIGFTSNISRPKYEWMVSGEKQTNDVISVLSNKDLKATKQYGVVFYNTFFKYLNVNLSYIMSYDCIGNMYYSNGNSLYSEYQNYADKKTFRSNMVIPFQFYGKKISGQFQINTVYDKICKTKNGFEIPYERKNAYWIIGTNTYVSYAPNNRLEISFDGSYNPYHNTSLQEYSSTASFDVETQYCMLKKKNLTLSLSVCDITFKDAKITNYFGNSKFFTIKEKIGPTVLLSVKFRFNKGQEVVNEYKDYNPNSSRLR